MKKMHVYLKITPSEYESLRWRLWLNWCEAKSLTAMEWQRMLANSGYNAWFNNELSKIEYRFREQVYYVWPKLQSAELVQRWKNAMMDLYRLFLRPEKEALQKQSLKQYINDPLGNELILN